MTAELDHNIGNGNYLRSLVPRIKAICCMNCKHSEKLFCIIRYENVEADDVCNYHPRISGEGDSLFDELESDLQDIKNMGG